MLFSGELAATIFNNKIELFEKVEGPFERRTPQNAAGGVIFNVEFYNVGKRRNNVVKMTASKKNKKNWFKENTRNSKF